MHSWRFGLLVLVLAISVPAGPVSGQESSSPFRMRASFVASLPLGVEWPVSHRERRPTRICMLGESDFADAFARELMGDAALRLTFEPNVGRFAIPVCDMLYVAPSGLAQYEALKPQIAGLPILTIGEGDAFLARGGMIAFAGPPAGTEPSREALRFRICPMHAAKVGISFDPMLIELAEKIRPAS